MDNKSMKGGKKEEVLADYSTKNNANVIIGILSEKKLLYSLIIAVGLYSLAYSYFMIVISGLSSLSLLYLLIPITLFILFPFSIIYLQNTKSRKWGLLSLLIIPFFIYSFSLDLFNSCIDFPLIFNIFYLLLFYYHTYILSKSGYGKWMKVVWTIALVILVLFILGQSNSCSPEGLLDSCIEKNDCRAQSLLGL